MVFNDMVYVTVYVYFDSFIFCQLGGKGMGATRVKANFSDIESAAQRADKEKEANIKAAAAMEAKNAEDAEKQL